VELTEKGSSIAHQTAAGLEEIVTGVNQVSELISEIAIASNEQAEGIAQVNQGLGQIDQVTQQNTANAEESAAASEELSVQARQLLQILARFQCDTGNGDTSSVTPIDLPAVESHGSWGGISAQSDRDDELICWSEQLATGIDSIDSQHRKLVDLINRTFVTMRDGGDDAAIRQVVGELVDYARGHFAHEEQLMQRHGYPKLDEHQRIHQDFMNQVDRFKTKMETGQRLQPAEVFNFLKRWLIEHIKREDRDGYGPFLSRQLN